MTLLTFTSDFGTRDGYVAAVKGVVIKQVPDARIIDISHEIPPGDIRAGAFVLWQAACEFPRGTVHLAVVDPGVGSSRRAIACSRDGSLYVGPDNGVLGLALGEVAGVEAHEVTRDEFTRGRMSPVFHGRDLFAPVAAWLANGGVLHEVGPSLDPASLVATPWPSPVRAGRGVRGEVVYVDHFGNLVTNISLGAPDALLSGSVEVGARPVPVARTYSEAEPQELLALCGSTGLLEIACNGGSAAALLSAEVGCVVSYTPGSGGGRG